MRIAPDGLPMREPTPSEQVLMEVTDREGVAFDDLPPLYHTIDPEQLDDILQGDDSIRVSFEYAGYRIAVSQHREPIVEIWST